MEGFNNAISNGFVIVDFYAPWCGDCVRIEPILKDLEKEYKIIKVSIDENEKIVVFSQFTRFLGIIADELKRENIEYCYIDGQTQNRQKEIEEFEDESKKVFLISLKAGGFGLNLTNAKRLIISDPWWNPAVERQAEDRIYRIGQTDDVTIYRLIVKNTVEEKIEVLKNTKDEVGDLLFANVKEITDLTPEELLKMFK